MSRVHGRNILVKPFTMFVADVSRFLGYMYQVRVQEVDFQLHISIHHSVDFKHFLNQPTTCCLELCGFPDNSLQTVFSVRPMTSLKFALSEDGRRSILLPVESSVPNTKNLLHSDSWSLHNFLSVQA